jgi:hypothetical protein
MCRVQLRCVGHREEGEDNGAESCMALLRVFLFFLVLSSQDEAKGDPRPLPWNFLILLE